MLSIPGFYQTISRKSADGCDAELASRGVLIESTVAFEEYQNYERLMFLSEHLHIELMFDRPELYGYGLDGLA